MSYFGDYYNELRYPLGTVENPGFHNAQLGALHAIGAHFSLRKETAIISMPTGSGKTVVAIATAFQQHSKRVLVVTPSRLVRNQIKVEFQTLNKLRGIGALTTQIPNPSVVEVTCKITSAEGWQALEAYDIIVATPNSISPTVHGVWPAPGDMFDLLLIDEAHHSRAETWESVLHAFPDAKRVLFTATPFRRDKREINGRFVYVYPMKKARDDGIFGDIEYIPVEKTQSDSDIDIARKAEEILAADMAAGFRHSLMVRTDQKVRADRLMEIYQRETTLNLEIVHSGYSYSHVKRTIAKLKDGTLDGIICVDMLGEGFDFPNLKVAAIHTPHKSLEITLQFIGRFTRTNAENIGKAKFLAIPSEITIEAKHLYEDGALWQDIITNLSKTRVDEEVYVRETIDNFGSPRTSTTDTENLSLFSLKPSYHVKIYRIPGGVDLKADINLPKGYEIVHRWDNALDSTAVFITKEQLRPDWAILEMFSKTEYDLFVVYYHEESKLLFINSSIRNDGIYEKIAMSLAQTSSPKILSLQAINKVLVGLDDTRFFNLGMRNQVNSTVSESYRTITGSNAQNAVRRTDGRLYHRGHLYGVARTPEGEQITIGYSSSSKVWSAKNSLIPQLLGWCRVLAERISGNGIVTTNSELDYISAGETIAKIPDGLLAAEWHDVTFHHLPMIECELNGRTLTTLFFDSDLRVDRVFSDDRNIRIVLDCVNFSIPFNYSIDDETMYSIVETENQEGLQVDTAIPTALVKWANKVENLKDYLNSYPLTFYFADFSTLEGTSYFPCSNITIPPFDTQQMVVVDWKNNNVSIKIECKTDNHDTSIIAIHDYLKQRLTNEEYDVVFYDHRTGEIADFVCMKDSADSVSIVFYHCKASKEYEAGERVTDAYEVCGQVIKSRHWWNKRSELVNKIIDRERNGSQFLKGDTKLLRELIDRSRNRKLEYQEVIVQPGISLADMGDVKVAELLAATNAYMISSNFMPICVMCSE